MFSKRLLSLTPYVPGEQPRNRKYIKLNTNENPFPPAPGVQAVLNNYQAEELRLYPDPDSTELKNAFARRFKLNPTNIYCGNGSDEVLSFIFYSFFDPDNGPVLFPDITYSFYPVYCAFYGLEKKLIPLKPDFSLDIQPYKDFAQNNPYAGIIFANPNAPTGISISLESIVKILDSVRSDRVVVIDEAYVDFGGESAVSLITEYPNLLITGTMSKSYSLAGLRIGYAAGSEDLIQALNRAKDSFNSYPISRIGQKLAVEAVKDSSYFQNKIDELIEIRTWTISELKLLGWTVLPSDANFIFASPSGRSAEDLYTALKEVGILVRYFSAPRTCDYLRISIGTRSEMTSLIQALKNIGL